MNELFTNPHRIKTWLDQHGIQKYRIHPDLSVSVASSVDLSGKNLEHLPFQFLHVSGYFNCERNQLTTLLGSPKTLSGSFFCANNRLTSLLGSPVHVPSYFDCTSNALTSLQGAPLTVGQSFYANHNALTSLEFSPSSVGASFFCNSNDLHHLEFFPSYIGGSCFLEHNPHLGQAQYTHHAETLRQYHVDYISTLRERQNFLAQLTDYAASTINSFYASPQFQTFKI